MAVLHIVSRAPSSSMKHPTSLSTAGGRTPGRRVTAQARKNGESAAVSVNFGNIGNLCAPFPPFAVRKKGPPVALLRMRFVAPSCQRLQTVRR